MKKTIIALTLMGAVATASAADSVITKQKDGTVVVNTTTIASDVRGFKGATPVKIYIKKGKVMKVEALPNKETPRY
ncbi:MAG: FMN-binding protein, partial [Muribaculaceae bacterium]|nr:FMN-binding protein [Muribaculaceae bacterium]